MHIGFDAKRLYCNFSGLGNYSRAMLKNLQEFYPKNEYHLYTTKVKKHLETDFFIDNIAFHTHISESTFKAYWRSYGIINNLKKDKIDIFHGLSHEIPFNIQKSGIKSIVTIHDLIFKRYPETYASFDRKMYDLKFRYSCKNADRIIAISESTKRDIIKYYGISENKIDVVYQSCNPLFYEESPIEDPSEILKKYNIPKKYLLSVGSIIKRKNLEIIIEAYHRLGSDFKIPLVIVGRGKEYKNYIQNKIKMYGLEDKMIWVDFLDDNSHLQIVYQNALAMIYPSIYEGFGLPIVEALLSKTPVIAANTSSLPEAGGTDSLYFDPLDINVLVEHILNVVNDIDLRKSMIENGYQHATHNFSTKVITDEVMRIYKKVFSY